MKLRFLIVTLALALTSRVEAQFDSNAKIVLFCSNTYAQCYSVEGLSGSPIAGVMLDTSFTLPANDSIHIALGYEQASFSIDTEHKCFRAVSLSTSYPNYPTTGPCTDNCTVVIHSVNFRLSLDSIHYVDSQGIITSTSDLPFSMSFLAEAECRCGHSTYGSSCSSPDRSHLPDTFYIKMIPNGFAGLSSNSPAQTFSLIGESREVLCSLAVRQRSNAMAVFDLMGRLVNTILVTDDRYITVPHLHPGCYFARLGDQVAKFVVVE